MPIKPIQRVKVGDAVFAQMKRMILNGEWQAGQRLPSENELKDRFGVSRISIREPLERLKILGLIETRQGSGTYIRATNQDSLFASIVPVFVQSDKDILEILEFRLAVECEAARLACSRMTRKELELLAKIVGKIEKAAARPEEAASLDLEFHLQIVRLSNNRYFYQVEQILRDILSANFLRVIEAIGPDIGIQHHAKILAALRSRDSEQAYLAMKDHIAATMEMIRQTQKNGGESFGKSISGT